MSEVIIALLIIAGISVLIGVGIYFIGKRRGIDQGKIIFLAVCAAMTIFFGLNLVKMKTIRGDWGERVVEQKIISRKDEREFSYQNNNNGSYITEKIYYLCYRQNTEICVDVDLNTWLKSKTGSQMSVIRVENDSKIYHENSEYVRGGNFIYFQILFGLFLVGTVYFLFKTLFPDGSEEYGDDKSVTTLFDDYD